MGHVKLHIPGPVEVSEKTFRAFCSPMIGHRGQGFKDLYAKIQPQLQQLLYTKQLVYISTSSAWGVMEGAIRNLVAKKVLNCMCGAFSDKWFDVSKRCGKEAEALQVPWGSPIRAEEVDKKLATGQFDALTRHPQRDLHRRDEPARGDRRAQEEISRRDVHRGLGQLDDARCRSSSTSWASTCCWPGTQKAFALPPGTAVFVCSPAALAKAATAEGPRLLLRFRRVPEERRAEHDAQHAEHRPRLCAGVQAARTSSPRAWKRAMRGIAEPTR